MSEIYDELNQLTYIKGKYFVAQKSMGKSTGGRNIPYLIVAKDEKAVNDWLEYTELAEKNPKAAIKGIESGKYDNLKVPVMYSNVHSNEIAATDGIMEFAWKLVENKDLSYKDLEGFTDEGKQKLKAQMGPEGEAGSTAVPDLVKDKSTYLGYLKDGNKVSGKVDLNKLYKVKNKKLIEVLQEDYYSLEELNNFLKNKDEQFVYVGRDIKKLKEKLLLAENNKNEVSAANVVKIYDSLEIVDSYNMKPQYLRKTESERELENDKNK